jgi:predicted RNase H-like nuclease
MLSLSHELIQRLIDEQMGDELDALCCAIQAAWAYSEREHNYSIPAGYEREGWIVDPALSSI